MADSVITTLSIQDKQTAALGKAQAAVESYAAKVQSTLEGIAQKYLTLGGIASTAMGFLAGSQASAMVETSKLADRLGMTSQALQSYEFAAKKAGIGSEEFGMLMGRFQAKLGEAAAGSGTAAQSFAQIGLSIDKIKGMKPEDAFRATIDALHALPDQSARSAAAMDLFSREGMKMMGIVQQGGGAFDAARQKLAAMGLTFDDVQTKAIRKATSAISDLKLSMQAAGQAAAIALAPMIQKVAESLTVAVVTISKLTESLGQGTVKAVLWGAAIGASIIVIAQAVDAVDTLVNAIKSVAKAQILAQAFSGPKGWGMIAAGVAAATVGVSYLSSEMGEAGEKARKSFDAAKTLQAANSQGAVAEKLAAEAVKEHAAALDTMKEKIDELLPSTERYRKELEKLRATLQEQAGTITIAPPAELTDADQRQLERVRNKARAAATLSMRPETEENRGSSHDWTQQQADQFVEQQVENARKWRLAANQKQPFTVDRNLSPEQQAQLDAGTKKLQQSILGIDSTPVAAYRDRIASFSKALREGLIDQEQYETAAKKARESGFGSDTTTKLEKYTEAVQRQTEALREGAISEEQYGRRMQAIQNEVYGEAAKTPAQKYRETMSDLAANRNISGADRAALQKQAMESSFGATPQSALQKFQETMQQINETFPQVWGRGRGGFTMVDSDEAKQYKEAAKKEYESASGIQALRDATRTPMEKFNAERDRLTDLFQQGPQNGGIDMDLLQRGLQRAQNEYDSTAKKAHPAAFESAEGMYNRIASAIGGWQERTDQEIAANTKKMAEGIATLVAQGGQKIGGDGTVAVFGP